MGAADIWKTKRKKKQLKLYCAEGMDETLEEGKEKVRKKREKKKMIDENTKVEEI